MNGDFAIESPVAGGLQHATPDAFVESHYEKVYALCTMFVDDPRESLALTNWAFRDCGPLPTALCLYRNVVLGLRGLTDLAAPVVGANMDSNLAWLLKDVVGMRYSEIAQVLCASFDEVKELISASRQAVLQLA